MKNITSQIASFITDTKYKDLTGIAIEQAKYCFLDWLGVTMIGAQEEASKIAQNFIQNQNCKEEATILNSNLKTNTIYAALSNGISGHVLDLDDIYPWGPGHPGATVFPAALAIAERNGSPGIDFIKAVILGFQIQFAIGEAIMPEHYKEGWHNTSTLGRFGAVSSVSSLLNMSNEEVINALGIAATSGGGLKGVFGSMSKSFNAGKACMDGVLAALLASYGFDSTKDSIENKQGFINNFASISNSSNTIKAIHGPLVIEKVRPKKFPSCYSTQSVVECMLSINSQLNKPLHSEDIESITCFVHPRCLEIAAIANPKTPLECRFSTQFCGSVALKKGKLTLEDFNDKNLADPDIINIIDKINFIAKDEYEKNRKAKTIVKFASGQILDSFVDLSEITKDRNKSNTNITDKFDSILEQIKIKKIKKDTLKKTILNLENISNIKEDLIDIISY